MSWFLYDRDRSSSISFQNKTEVSNGFILPISNFIYEVSICIWKEINKKLKDPAFLSIGKVFREILSFQK